MPRGVKKVVEETEQTTAEVVQEAEAVDAAAEENKVEDEAAEENKVEDEAADEVVDEVVAEPQVDEPEAPVNEKKEKSAKKAEKAEDSITAEPENEWKFVTALRIYPYPSDLSRTTLFTGNVRVVSEYKGLKTIEYMKYGYGLVTAVTDQL